MRFLTIEKVEPAMILCKPVYDGDMNLLLGANKVLTVSNIKRMKNLGFRGVYIYDNFHENDNIEDIVSQETMLEAAKAIKKVDIDSAIFYSNRIVDDILNADRICLEIVELKTYDDYTYRHCVNVAILSCMIGIGLNLNYEKLKQVALAGLLHDIGKTKLDPDLLNKPEKLTPEEFETVKNHAQLGYDIIKSDNRLSSFVKSAVLLHHENEDGTGYFGYPSLKIPLFAKIIHVADVYDAILSKRPYKESLPVSEALEYLMGACGTLFNKEIVEAFLKYITPYPIGSEITLSNQEKGIVIKTNDIALQRPIVKTYNGEEIDLYKRLNLTIIDSTL